MVEPMTLEAFENNYYGIQELKEFCNETRCELMNNYYSYSELDEMVCEQIREMTNHEYWDNIRDYALTLPDSGGEDDYFIDDDYEGWMVASNLDYIFDVVREWAYANGYIIDEEDEDDDNEPIIASVSRKPNYNDIEEEPSEDFISILNVAV